MKSVAASVDDEALVAAFRAGQPQAFEIIVRRHYPRLLRVAEQRCGVGALADDAVQAGLIRAHRYLRDRGTVQNLGAWLRRVVFNCATDLLTAERKPHAALESAEGVEAPPQPESEASELRAMVADEIGKLPEIYREPLVLCYLHGIEAREIAAQLRDNLHSVKSRIARGRRELRRRLEPLLLKGGYLS